MAHRTDSDLLAFFDAARPNARYWATIALLSIAIAGSLLWGMLADVFGGKRPTRTSGSIKPAA
jgi:hypothetical protein